jgi:hypothetical protein
MALASGAAPAAQSLHWSAEVAMHRWLLRPGFAVLLWLLASMANAASEPADALAERLLTALGGRAAWARLTNLVNDSQQNRAGEPPLVRAVITMDFTRPRLRVETTAPGLHLIRVVDGDRHWRLTRAGNVEPYPLPLLEEDRRFYAGHVYRNLHRVAARDPAVRLEVGSEGRLELHEGGKRIAWYLLDVRGEPYRYGAHDDEQGSIFGQWEFEQDGIRHPLWVSSRDGSWRAMLKTLRVNAPLDDRLFEPPPR